MKKFIAILLSVAMIISVAVVPAFAEESKVETSDSLESVFVEGENSLIVFVTGIGQSYSYLFDESYTAEGAFEKGTLQDYENYAPLVAEGKYLTRWNLFNSFDEAFSDIGTIFSIVTAVGGLLVSGLIGECVVSESAVKNIVKNLFKFNLVDEQGNSHPRVVTPRYAMPVSEYPYAPGEDGKLRSEARERFFSAIPCEDIAKEKFGENYEDFLYVYNYSAFSYTSKNVEGLHDFVETIIANNKVGAKDVVLIPMSMGASVVSARRGGNTATFDQLNKYFTINQMPVVSSNYWNEIHGNTAEQALQDLEGLQTMRILGNNMAWLLKCIAIGKEEGLEPIKERKIMTNFIR